MEMNSVSSDVNTRCQSCGIKQPERPDGESVVCDRCDQIEELVSQFSELPVSDQAQLYTEVSQSQTPGIMPRGSQGEPLVGDELKQGFEALLQESDIDIIAFANDQMEIYWKK